MTQQHDNPFARTERTPSVSWAAARPGDQIVGRVVEAPSLVQARDFATGKPETWDNGDPKWNIVTPLEIDGERKGLWCVKPSALYGAIVEALDASGRDAIEVDGWLRVTYTGDKPSERPGMNPAKQFTVDYRPPSAFDGYGSRDAQPTYQQERQPTPLQNAQNDAMAHRRQHDGRDDRPPVAPNPSQNPQSASQPGTAGTPYPVSGQPAEPPF